MKKILSHYADIFRSDVVLFCRLSQYSFSARKHSTYITSWIFFSVSCTVSGRSRSNMRPIFVQPRSYTRYFSPHQQNSYVQMAPKKWRNALTLPDDFVPVFYCSFFAQYMYYAFEHAVGLCTAELMFDERPILFGQLNRRKNWFQINSGICLWVLWKKSHARLRENIVDRSSPHQIGKWNSMHCYYAVWVLDSSMRITFCIY